MREIVLELKVIADVGLIGKPNAGKEYAAQPVIACATANRGVSLHDQIPEPRSWCGSMPSDRS